MAVINNEALSFTNMSSTTIYQYRGESLLANENWWIGYCNNRANHNLCIKFTPSKTLTKVVFKLTAHSYTQLGSKPCYYYLNTSSTHPTLATINSSGTSFTFSNKIATITLSQTFTAGTTYYLWISPSRNDANFAAYIYTTNITCTTTVKTYTISYNGNAQNSGTVSNVPSSQTKVYGTALTLSTTKPTHTNTTATGYKVTFNANGGTTSKSSATSTITKKYTFSKWNTALGGTGTSYNAGASYTANAAATLYAQWTITNTNGSVTLPTTTQCTRDGHDLLGFATSESATSAAYSPGASYTPTKATTLYAVWKANGLVYIDNGTELVAYQIFIDTGSSWDQYAPHVDNGTSFELYS